MGKKKYLIIFFIFLLAGCTMLCLHMKAKMNEKETENEEVTEMPTPEPENVPDLGIKMVIDSGHGGFDPGKVNADGVVEKDINLQIALKLKEKLEQQGIEITMTRDTDKGMYEETSKSKKMEDLNNRCQLIAETEPLCTISIHQNSFPDESVYGPQVFYYHDSESSAQLAQFVQESLNTDLNIEKPRETKNNQSYYLLKKSSSTTIIVECGFLSNASEAQKLTTEDYQNQIADAILDGVMKYVNEQSMQNGSADEDDH